MKLYDITQNVGLIINYRTDIILRHRWFTVWAYKIWVAVEFLGSKKWDLEALLFHCVHYSAG